VKTLLRSAIALYHRFRKTNAELLAAKKTLSERETIDRAKFLFMKQERCKEEEAYRWLRKQAMQHSKKIADIASDYLSNHAGKPVK
ncbi:MAG: ANTAR domain-containing protein, partial [Acetobacter orientalis]|uniref:ANTAR domain-containing response regulator n=1 Tax=Acetobacter orientalis TaxID=146474 RepID=UPI0039EB9B27